VDDEVGGAVLLVAVTAAFGLAKQALAADLLRRLKAEFGC